MSDFSYIRALNMHLLFDLENVDKEEFKQEVQKELGLSPGQDCDSICGAMDDQEFIEFVQHVKEILRNKKRKVIEPIYA
ncbi:MAG: hypothetical protein ACREBU_18380 [Nitrososphaera sp.]